MIIKLSETSGSYVVCNYIHVFMKMKNNFLKSTNNIFDSYSNGSSWELVDSRVGL